MSLPKILIVEDDRAIADVIAYNLIQIGYEVLRADNGNDGVDKAKQHMPDVIVLDVMLPGIDGLEVCRRLRGLPETQAIQILMLTAKSEEGDQLVGFSVGADDYVVKPFSVRILMERIKALVRRRSQGESSGDSDLAVSGPISVDRIRHKILVDGKPIEFTASEFRLLESLVRAPGRVFDRTELIELALGADTLVLERTIDVHVRSIRKKLGRFADLVETVRGVGYRYREPAE